MKFLRRSADRYSKLGKRRKKKQTWRKPTGRDNKMREKRRGYPPIVSIGYGTKNKSKQIVKIMNQKDLDKVGKNDVAIIGNVGKKKRIEIVNKANEKRIKFENINVKQFLKKTNKPKKKDVGKDSKEKTKDGKK